MDKHTQQVKNNMFYDVGITDEQLKPFIESDEWTFDTESCEEFRGTVALHQPKHMKYRKIARSRVYAYAISNMKNDSVVYGLSLDNFIKLLDRYARLYSLRYKLTANKKQEHGTRIINIGVHNLGWDAEFLKYALIKNGYTYKKGNIKKGYKTTAYTSEYIAEPNTFNITKNKGIIYFLTLTLKFESKTIDNKPYYFQFRFYDTYKLMTTPLKNIYKFTTSMPDMYKKIEEGYDYNRFREPFEKLSMLEKRYLYNDVISLKYAIKDFYLKLTDEFKVKKSFRTASGVAFSVLKNICFSNEKEYREYYELDKPCPFDLTRKTVEKNSYVGGYTSANPKYVNKHLKNIVGYSLDINSSYPFQMDSALLPYGKPIEKLIGKVPEYDKSKFVTLIEFGFDVVKPKKGHNLCVFKIGSLNKKAIQSITGVPQSGNEYFSTNMKNSKEYVEVIRQVEGSQLKNSNYQMSITSIEFDFFIKNYEFGLINSKGKIEWNKYDIGNVLMYRAEKHKLSAFVQKFTTMKIAFKGLTHERFNFIYNKYEFFRKNLDFIKPYIEQSEKYAICPNPVLVAFAKLCLNSSYGKFGTNTERAECELFEDEGLLKFATDSKGDITYYNSKEFYRPVACFITAGGRLKLWNTIIKLGTDNFIYSDTDSIYLLGSVEEGQEKMKEISELFDSVLLGHWDNESRFNEFKVLGQKKYMYRSIDDNHIEMKCAGLPKVAQKETASKGFENFKLGLVVSGKLQQVKTIGGAQLMTVDYTIKDVMF